MKKQKFNNSQSGAVSLFVVIFAALLITIVTVSFVRIMVQDQQQATTTDLSQSALDSAQAGVEDAKRAIIRYQNICSVDATSSACNTAKDNINSTTCNTAVETLSDVQDATTIDNGNIKEIKVQNGSAGNNLDQAYTCVKVNLNTDDYLGNFSKNDSEIIPLRAVSGQTFDSVQVEWFSSNDFSSSYVNSDNSPRVDLSTSSSQGLISNWPLNMPSIMRFQLIQFGSSGFNLSDFDKDSSGKSNADTLFLYPIGTTGNKTSIINTLSVTGNDTDRNPTNKPVDVVCSGKLSEGGYACSATIKLSQPINSGDRVAYLRLTSLYNKSSFRVTMKNTSLSGSTIKFSAVQPEIDSTGRANDLFRRVVTRVQLTDMNFAYPEATVDINSNFCKNFDITDNEADYNSNCTP